MDASAVKKLDGAAGYPLWKLTIENIVWAAGIHDIVFGKETRHATDADLQLKWDISNRAGMGIILQTVEEKLTSHVFSCTTAVEMWKKLESTFGTSTAWTKQELIQEFYGMSLDDQTPTEMVDRLQTVAGKLNAMGYTSLDEPAILGKVLHELKGPRFESFVKAWSVLQPADKTVANFV